MQIRKSVTASQLCRKNINTFTVTNISCAYCGTHGGEVLRKLGAYSMQCCSNCGFVYLNPRPSEEDLCSYYQSYYLPQDARLIRAWDIMMCSVFFKAANTIKGYFSKGSILDIGCGFGFFLNAMKQRGWDVEGIELSEPGIAYARDVFKVPVKKTSLEQADFPDSCFDVITAFYVIEHSYNPLIFLKKIYSLLKPGGLVLLRYPHTRPLENLLSGIGMQNNVYDIPFHLSDFSPKMIKFFLHKAGFSGCKHFIGGYTLPEKFHERIWSTICGAAAEALFSISLQKYLMPGVSKNVIAQK